MKYILNKCGRFCLTGFCISLVGYIVLSVILLIGLVENCIWVFDYGSLVCIAALIAGLSTASFLFMIVCLIMEKGEYK